MKKKLTQKEFIKRQERRLRQRMNKRMKFMYEQFGTCDPEILKRFNLPSLKVNLDHLKSSQQVSVAETKHLKKGSRRYKAMLRRRQDDLTKRVKHHIVNNSPISEDEKINSDQELTVKSKVYGQNELKKKRNARLRKNLGKKKGNARTKKNLGIERVNWELLPVGTDWSSFEKHFNKKVKKSGNKLDPNKVEVARERFRRIYVLKPNKVYRGVESYSDYFALLFNGTDKVLLESVIYGNAAYVVSSNWRELSRLTKTELKDNYKPVGKVKDFRHTGDWFSKLKNYLQTGFE